MKKTQTLLLLLFVASLFSCGGKNSDASFIAKVEECGEFMDHLGNIAMIGRRDFKDGDHGEMSKLVEEGYVTFSRAKIFKNSVDYMATDKLKRFEKISTRMYDFYSLGEYRITEVDYNNEAKLAQLTVEVVKGNELYELLSASGIDLRSGTLYIRFNVTEKKGRTPICMYNDQYIKKI